MDNQKDTAEKKLQEHDDKLGVIAQLVKMINSDVKALLILALTYAFYTTNADNKRITDREYKRLEVFCNGVIVDNHNLQKELVSVYKENNALQNLPIGKLDTIIQNQKIINNQNKKP